MSTTKELLIEKVDHEGYTDSLDENELDTFKRAFPHAEYLAYSYQIGSYCGSGRCIFYSEGKWFTDDLGHCSCYGPMDSVNECKPEDILQLMRKCSSDLYDELLVLVKQAQTHGYFKEFQI